jgi:hypothetical protein
MEARISQLREKYKNNAVARDVFDSAQREIDFYRQFSSYYGYEFFVAQKAS